MASLSKCDSGGVMANIAVVGCGNTGQKLAESLQDKMPEADFVVANHFAKGETSTVPNRINTRLKRRLTEDELTQFETDISKFKRHVQPGDTYWWWRNKQGYRYPGYVDQIFCGIVLVRGQDIVATVSNGFPAHMVGKYDGYPETIQQFEY